VWTTGIAAIEEELYHPVELTGGICFVDNEERIGADWHGAERNGAERTGLEERGKDWHGSLYHQEFIGSL